jgi:ATP-dependent Clp protease ATP-binding subunit ClpA
LTSNHGFTGADVDAPGLDEATLAQRGLDHLKRHIGPEFIKRMDEVVIFKYLKPDDVEKIIDQKFAAYARQFATAPGARPVAFNIDPAARKLISNNLHRYGSCQHYGDRDLEAQG